MRKDRNAKEEEELRYEERMQKIMNHCKCINSKPKTMQIEKWVGEMRQKGY